MLYKHYLCFKAIECFIKPLKPLFLFLIYLHYEVVLSPIKALYECMGLATRGRSTARSRSRSTTGQKLTIKIGNVLHKSFRFIPEAVCFKSSVPLLYSPEQHRTRCPYTRQHFPPGNVVGVLSVPRIKSE